MQHGRVRWAAPLGLVMAAVVTWICGGASHAAEGGRRGRRVLAGGLRGTIQSAYTTQAPFPDAGTTLALSGFGRIRPLGNVQASGEIHTVGTVRTGRATGTLTLANNRGTLTLDLEGPPQGALAPPPPRFHYTVSGGTGDFAEVTGAGKVTFHRTFEDDDRNGRAALRFSPAPQGQRFP